MRTTSAASALAIATLAAALSGCNHLPQFATMIGIRAPHEDLGPPQTRYAAEDRLYADAVKAIDKRNYGEALGILQVAREGRPDDARVLTAMAVVYDKLGRFDLSDRYYDQAEKADPGSRIVALDRRYSMLLRSAGKANADGSGVAFAAAHAMTTAVAPRTAALAAPAVAPNGEALYAQAVNAIAKRQYGVAIGMLRQARDTKPGDARILTALAVTYDHLGRFDLSSRYYDQAEKAAPGSSVIAQDRRSSQMLQQHGGYATAADVILVADPTTAAVRPMRVAKASSRHSGHG